jgi:bacterial/archaeal transporter family protein
MGGEANGGGYGWLAWALGSGAMSALMGVLTKAGLRNVDQHVGLAIQAPCIAVFAWAVVLIRGNAGDLNDLDGRAWLYLLGGGFAISLCYFCLFNALKVGEASAVWPIDKLSLVFAVVLAVIFLGEKLTWATGIGAALMAAGAVVIAVGKGSQ